MIGSRIVRFWRENLGLSATEDLRDSTRLTSGNIWIATFLRVIERDICRYWSVLLV